MFRVPVELPFPARCCGCSARVGGDDPYLCAACAAGLVAAPEELSLAVPLAFPVRALFVLQGPGRDLVHALKYEGRTGIARRFAPWLAAASREAVSARRVAAVPLHWRRKWRRGYDQAALLAAALVRERPALKRARGLRRRRATVPQVGHRAEERRRNVSGAFIADSRAVAGQHCILVDDVVTTGATLAAVAVSLRLAGARPVLAVALAVSPASLPEAAPTDRADRADQLRR